MGASCIITLGGDGTNKAVAKECGDIPLIPLSTGTNNVFPMMLEGSVAGFAAAVADKDQGQQFLKLKQTKKLSVYKNGVLVDIALIDVSISGERFIGSRALWDLESIREIFVTVAKPHSIGMSAIAGSFFPISEEDPKGLYLRLAPEGPLETWAAIAPGLIRCVKIDGYGEIGLEERINIKTTTGVIALDGERELTFGKGDKVVISLSRNGPKVVDVEATLRAAAEGGFFRGRGWQ
jgi:predicted polyphosphate/ATP-dependent NAD kinase